MGTRMGRYTTRTRKPPWLENVQTEAGDGRGPRSEQSKAGVEGIEGVPQAPECRRRCEAAAREANSRDVHERARCPSQRAPGSDRCRASATCLEAAIGRPARCSSSRAPRTGITLHSAAQGEHAAPGGRAHARLSSGRGTIARTSATARQGLGALTGLAASCDRQGARRPARWQKQRQRYSRRRSGRARAYVLRGRSQLGTAARPTRAESAARVATSLEEACVRRAEAGCAGLPAPRRARRLLGWSAGVGLARAGVPRREAGGQRRERCGKDGKQLRTRVQKRQCCLRNGRRFAAGLIRIRQVLGRIVALIGEGQVGEDPRLLHVTSRRPRTTACPQRRRCR